jgi:hypothetical protein
MIYRAAASKVKEMKKLKKAPLLNVVWRPVAVASTHAIAGREEEVCDHFPRVIEHSFFPTRPVNLGALFVLPEGQQH